MKHKTVKTKDVRKFLNAIQDLLNRAMGTEGMGLLWGPPGTGKTTTMVFMVNLFNGIYVRALGCSTVTSILGDLCRELGGERKLRRSDMVEYIVDKLTKDDQGEPLPPRPIFIDEADYCFRQFEIVDSLRDIYDLSGCPVILIGMEEIAKKIKEQGRFARRITQWIEFNGLDLEDTAQVARECCEVELSPDLIEYLHRETKGNIGRCIIGLTKIEQYARANRLDKISAEQWGERPLYFDQPIFGRKKNGNGNGT